MDGRPGGGGLRAALSAHRAHLAGCGTVEQSIKVHRGRVMEKLGVDSLVELVRRAQRLDVAPAD